MKAIEAAIHGRQWSKAVQIVETQDPSATEEYHKQIADHYASIKNYEVNVDGCTMSMRYKLFKRQGM